MIVMDTIASFAHWQIEAAHAMDAVQILA